jgi:hypothetical protein
LSGAPQVLDNVQVSLLEGDRLRDQEQVLARIRDNLLQVATLEAAINLTIPPRIDRERSEHSHDDYREF